MPAPRELNPDAGPVALLGHELRKYRLARKLSQEKLAEKINFSASLIGFIERADRVPRREFIEVCEQALDLNGELLRFWPQISKEASPKWFHAWLDIEPQARTLRTWEPNLVPGLLQTEEYMRAVLSGRPGMTREKFEELVVARQTRQAIFTRSNPPIFWAVLDETVLWRPLGGKDVMRRQLEQLAEMADHPFVSIQVVPLASGSTAGLLGAFVIAQLPSQPDTVYVESPAKGYVTDRPSDVAVINDRYEALRADALPARASIELIRETMVKRWT
ncbi:helix-turn-helix domain-containing protein [Acrocarpospora catenulata]|uniref:helix-turn-helix domain-containing protein n=1 Tax=Acrocarpospora catenulata TaxID=2836182 RepID=UPI001BDAE083|nr:helix-turn-helix transcriptional regulator [Acrocarpospora catenulata]